MEKARILIVEDEAIIAMEVESQLQSLGYEVTSIVDTGEKAIKKAETDKPDLILMDIRIKGEMDGIDTAEAIRSRFGIPVIFSTAYLDEERIERVKITMPFGYVLKPIQERDLRVTIEMALYVAEVDSERKKAETKLRESEAKIRNKLKSLTEPDVDIGSLELSDIIDAEALQSLMEDFYNITGMGGAIVDIKGNVLVGVGWQDICVKFHRVHPETAEHCIESDTELSQGVKSGEFKSYHCKNNMWDMASPINIAGQHVGNIFFGQYFYTDEEVNLELFRNNARKYGFDEDEYLSAVNRVPRHSKETVHNAMSLYSKLAEIISALSFSNIKLAKTLSEGKLIEERLTRNETKYRTLFENSPYGVFLVDNNAKYIEVNDAACEMTGYSKEELLCLSIPEISAPDEEIRSQDMKPFLDIQSKGKGEGIIHIKHKDGSMFKANLKGVKIDDNSVVGICEKLKD
jgi:PAS domain S-box-containing protein